MSLEKQAQTTGPARIIASASGKVAQTLVEKVDIKGSVSYLEVRLVTGRTHQIRVHCTETGHPLLGDRKYGERESDKALGLGELPPLCLHARSIRFIFPLTEQAYCLVAPVDTDFARVLSALGFDKTGV